MHHKWGVAVLQLIDNRGISQVYAILGMFACPDIDLMYSDNVSKHIFSILDMHTLKYCVQILK